MAASNPVPKLYQSVIDDVVTNVREAFLDDGVDEQILQELRQLWESKLNQSKAVDPVTPDKKELVGLYAQQQQQLLQQKQQQQQSAGPRQVARATPSQQTPAKPATVTTNAPTTVTASQHVQLPVFNQATGHFEVSGAAAQAQNALGGLIPGGTVTLQTPNGPMQFIIQAPTQQQQAGSVTLPPGVVTTQNIGQVDGQIDSVEETDGGARRPEGRAGETLGVSPDTKPGVSPDTRPRVSDIPQVDGRNDTSSDEDDDDDDDNDDDDQNDEDNEDGVDEEEEDPLNSDDDVTDEDPAELFDTDNVVVCQFDKINRAKNRWKFHLKDGIMNLNGRDLVFQKCTGDAEW